VGNEKIHGPFASSNIAIIVASRDIRLVEHVALKEGSEARSSEAKEHTEAKLMLQNNIKPTSVYDLLGYKAVWAVESQPTYRRNISPPSLVLKYKASKIRTLLSTCFRAGTLFGLFFYSEDGGDMFLRNVS
jgi:hypothetical protein